MVSVNRQDSEKESVTVKLTDRSAPVIPKVRAIPKVPSGLPSAKPLATSSVSALAQQSFPDLKHYLPVP
jgi:hypothetical protein